MLNLIFQILFATGLRPSFIIGHTARRLQVLYSEIQHVEGWAGKYNLKLNHKKSCEILFVRPSCNRHIDVPPPAVNGIDKVQHITALGVTLSHNFSMTKHIDTVMAGCARALYGL